MSDIIYVAASGIGLSDRDSSGLYSSPTLRTNHQTHIETHGFMSPATSPATTLTVTRVVDQELA
jgi:hypothetical protein